jgi:hypothetical protein
MPDTQKQEDRERAEQERQDHEWSFPTLASGSADKRAVSELGRLLEQVGLETSVSRGENPGGVVDQSVMNAVHKFRADNQVDEPDDGYDQRNGNAHIGPVTYQALVKAAEKKHRAR